MDNQSIEDLKFLAWASDIPKVRAQAQKELRRLGLTMGDDKD